MIIFHADDSKAMGDECQLITCSNAFLTEPSLEKRADRRDQRSSSCKENPVNIAGCYARILEGVFHGCFNALQVRRDPLLELGAV